MQAMTTPATALVTDGHAARLRRESVTGWLMTHHRALLAPTFHFDAAEARSIGARRLDAEVSRQIGAAIVGPRALRIADRLAIAEFSFRDTKRRIPAPLIAIWL